MNNNNNSQTLVVGPKAIKKKKKKINKKILKKQLNKLPKMAFGCCPKYGRSVQEPKYIFCSEPSCIRVYHLECLKSKYGIVINNDEIIEEAKNKFLDKERQKVQKKERKSKKDKAIERLERKLSKCFENDSSDEELEEKLKLQLEKLKQKEESNESFVESISTVEVNNIENYENNNIEKKKFNSNTWICPWCTEILAPRTALVVNDLQSNFEDSIIDLNINVDPANIDLTNVTIRKKRKFVR